MTNLLYPICFTILMWSDYFPGYEAEPILGGQPDRGNEAIWLVSYQLEQSDGTWLHMCGGSIISDRHIITAAHCFVVFSVKGTLVWDENQNARIVIGSNDLNSATNPEFQMKIDKVIIHKAYTRKRKVKTFFADVALIRLKGYIDLSTNRDKYGSIDLFNPSPAEKDKYDKQEGFVAGFGATKVNCGPRGISYERGSLRKILPVHFTKENCPDVAGMRCIRHEKSDDEPSGVGYGDSGGPLYYKNDNKFVLVGVISSSHIMCDIRISCDRRAKITFLPVFKTFLENAMDLDIKPTFPDMSVKAFIALKNDYLVLPDQAKLARKFFVERQ